MTTYTIQDPNPNYGGVFDAPTHKAAHAQLCAQLSVGGPRRLIATTEAGAEVAAGLFDGDDYIRARDGRIIQGDV